MWFLRERERKEDDWKVLSPGARKFELTLREMERLKEKQVQG